MVFELWGNIGVRKGNYKLWSDVGRNYSPDWPALAAELERTDLALYDLSKDSAEEHDLRTKVPEVYAEMKKELLSHLSQINSDYPGSTSPAGNPEKSKSTKNKTDPEPSKRPSRDQFFRSRDRNSDGFITLKEFIGNPKGRDVPALTKRFGKLDRDGDGKLQREEIK